MTLRELILLCKNGFPDGALGLARNLFEQFIIISVFEAQCEGVDRDRMVEKYYADYNVQRYKNLKTMCRYAGQTEKMQDYENELAKLWKQFSVSKLKDYWWSGHYSFTDMCEYVIEHTDGNYKTMVINLYLLRCNNWNGLYGNRQGIHRKPKDGGASKKSLPETAV